MKQQIAAKTAALASIFFMCAAYAVTHDITTTSGRLGDAFSRRTVASTVISNANVPRNESDTYRITWAGAGGKDSYTIVPIQGGVLATEIPGSHQPAITDGGDGSGNGGGGGAGACVPTITVSGDWILTEAYQGGVLISSSLDFYGDGVGVSGCEGAGNPFGYP